MVYKSSKPQILRDAKLHSQPHTLGPALRHVKQAPGDASRMQSTNDIPRFVGGDVAHAAQAILRTQIASPDDVYEEAKKKGYVDGVSAGKRQGFEEGRKEGCALGKREGEAEARASYTLRLGRLDAMLNSLCGQIEQRVHQVEDDLVEIVFSSVCRIAGESAVSREGVRAYMQNAILQICARPILAVRLHPQDYAALQEDQEFAALIQLDTGKKVQWIVDERVHLGGCIIDTPEGSLDARLETQLSRLRDALATVRRARCEQKAET